MSRKTQILEALTSGNRPRMPITEGALGIVKNNPLAAVVAAAMLPGALGFAAREDHTVAKMLGTEAADYTDADAFGRFEQAYEQGTSPMTDSFDAFKKLSSDRTSRTKEARGALSAIGGMGGNILDDVARMIFSGRRAAPDAQDITEAAAQLAKRRSNLAGGLGSAPGVLQAEEAAAQALGATLTRPQKGPPTFLDSQGNDITHTARQKMEEIMWGQYHGGGDMDPAVRAAAESALEDAAKSLGGSRSSLDVNRFVADAPADQSSAIGKGLLGGMGLLGLGLAVDTGQEALFDPMVSSVRSDMFSLEDRVNADETFAKKFLEQSGKNVADTIHQLATSAGRAGFDAVADIPAEKERESMFETVMQGDPHLSRATPEERDMLRNAFSSMTRFGPNVAKDRFAVQNFLREALVMSNGPDYNTAAQLARAERDITGGR